MIDSELSAIQALAAKTKDFVRERGATTCPLYQFTRGGLESVASLVLLAVGKRRIAVTADHALRALDSEELVLGGDRLVVLGRSQFSHTVGAPDRYDLAFAELEPGQAVNLGSKRFLPWTAMALAERPIVERPHGSKYIAHGYPCQQNRKATDGTWKPHSMSLWALPTAEERYSEVGANPDTHLVLEFDRKQASDASGPMTSPKLNGMSGCGVWTAPDPHSGAAQPCVLVAVLTEHHQQSSKLIVATRMNILLDGIRRVPHDAGG